MAAHVVIPDASFPPAVTVLQTKNALRSLIRQQRKALAGDQRQQQQAAVQARLKNQLEAHKPQRTALYLACGSELDLAADDPQWRVLTDVFVPVIGKTELRFAPPQPPWTTTPLGTREPVGEHALGVADMDLIVLPLLACDTHGVRLGQGGGWYDRSLDQPGVPVPLCVGVGFDLQLIDHVPTEAHDHPLDVFISARHMRAFTKRGKQWLTGS